VSSKILFVAVIMLLSVFAFPSADLALAQDAKSTPQTIKGELVLLAGEVGVVKDSSGKATHLNVSPTTKIEGNPKPGDQVEVSVSGDGQALSIKPAH
jgi:hypothetical protein